MTGFSDFLRRSLLPGLLLAAGCAAPPPPDQPEETAVVVCCTLMPITLDGKLDEAAWHGAVAHELKPIGRKGLPPREAARLARDASLPGRVKFLRDAEYLYVGAEFADHDVINFRHEDQTRLYRYGDLLEFFIAPQDGDCCWELYAAANGAKTSYFYRSRGVVGLENIYEGTAADLMPGFEVKAQVDGTLNFQQDRDRAWSVEMRIPLRELAAGAGYGFAPGRRWCVLAARYNYGSDLYMPQLSSFPLLPGGSFHLQQYYAPVEFRRPEGEDAWK